MSIVKIIEVISEGETVDAAIRSAVTEAARTVDNIKQINVDYIEGLVKDNKVTKFRVNSKISFVVEH